MTPIPPTVNIPVEYRDQILNLDNQSPRERITTIDLILDQMDDPSDSVSSFLVLERQHTVEAYRAGGKAGSPIPESNR